MNSKIYVIIVTYNGMRWYKRCFDSLRTSVQPIDIIVVDNASSDDTVDFIKSNYPEVILIESKINLGFGQANNKGIRYALDNNADYVFLLNQDTWIESDSIKKLIYEHKKNPEYGIISPMHLNSNEQMLETGFMHYISDYSNTDPMFINDLFFDTLKSIYQTKYVNAAAWLLPKTILNDVGGFDPIFFHYGEDDNYLQRAIFHNYKIGIVPSSRIIHDTKIRLEQPKQTLDNNDKWLLTQYTDINKRYSYVQLLKYFSYKILTMLCRFQPEKVRHYSHMMCFVIKLNNRIKISRIMNSIKKSSWL